MLTGDPPATIGRPRLALVLALAGLLPCLWWLGTVAYFVGEGGEGRLARAARALGLFDSVLLLLFLLYAIAYAVGVLASPR